MMNYEQNRQYKNYITYCKNKVREIEELMNDLEYYKEQSRLSFEEFKKNNPKNIS